MRASCAVRRASFCLPLEDECAFGFCALNRLIYRRMYSSRLLSFFFFQAEDGIRDVAVTGVQTCALPIFRPRPLGNLGLAHELGRLGRLRIQKLESRAVGAVSVVSGQSRKRLQAKGGVRDRKSVV